MRRTPLSPTPLAAFACALLCLAPYAPARAAAGADAAADSLAAFPPPRVRAWQTGLARPDRLQHASLSGTLAAGATAAGARPLAAFAGTFALGLLKECWDARATRFDAVDLAADAAGAALGASAARGVR